MNWTLGVTLVTLIPGANARAQQGMIGGMQLAGTDGQAVQDASAREATQRGELAESILDLRESAARRTFDASYRAGLKTDLMTLSVAQLESLRSAGGEGNIRELLGQDVVPNVLGETGKDLVFTPVTPCRIIDTRLSAGGILNAGAAQAFKAAGVSTDLSGQGGSATGCGIPTGATALSVNFGATQSAGPGNLRAYAWASPAPTAPNAAVLNFGNLAPSGLVTIAGGALVPICNPAATTCTFDVYLQVFNSATHVVADVTGYFSKASSKVTVLTYSGSSSLAGSFTYALYRTIGTFTKTSASTGITTIWNPTINTNGTPGSTFCQYQVRIDSAPPASANGFPGIVNYGAHQFASLQNYWTGLSAGSHTVSIWLRSNATSCGDNNGNFDQYLYVIEE